MRVERTWADAHAAHRRRSAQSPYARAGARDAPVVPERSARRATARRATTRRATSRQHKDDVEGRILEYLKEHPQGTAGEIAKRLNADRDSVAAGLAHMVRARKITKQHEVG
jgi:predicted HTH transcriptional regulator